MGHEGGPEDRREIEGSVEHVTVPLAPRTPETVDAIGAPRSLVAGVIVLATLACLATVYFARDFLLPIAVALLLNFFLSPAIRALGRIHVPPPIGAALIVLSFVAVVGFSGYELAGPVQGWVTHAPETVRKAGTRLRTLTKPVGQVTKVAEQVEKATAPDASPRTEVVVRGPTLAARMFGTTQAIVENAIEIVLLLYFLLASGDLFLEKLIKVLPRVRDQRKAVTIARAIESSISTYLVTIAAINVGEGAVVALAMWMLGMPTPVVWGVMVACLEFIPYVGMVVAVTVLTIAGLTTFPSLPHALAAPAVFVVINALQGNVVSPLIMSKRLTLNPVALFIGLAFWWWVWGILGALLAVPLLSAFKILCDRVESLSAVGEFLGGRDPHERRRIVRAHGEGAAPPEAVSASG
jgi:predicted PurR-regulated permease PerM